ncbi:MAG: pyridoxal phosphate-dependent decarboxylase family protein [Acidimicrobiales bacterium]
MFVFDEQMTELVFEYCRDRLSVDPVPLGFGGAGKTFDAALDGLITAGGARPDDVLQFFVASLATAVVSCDSPRFLSFIPVAPSKAASLFDMLVSCCSLKGTSWLGSAGLVAAENQALRLLADLAEFPPDAGGCFVSGGSMGNLSALVVARDMGARHRPGGSPARPLVAISTEAHSSVVKALHIIGVDPLLVPADGHRLTGEVLRSALSTHPRAEDVVAVVATAGTTNAGIIDDLAGIAQVARDRGLWFHVDAAYGGAGLFARALRDRFRGIELADSFVVDPHKWLFAPVDCAALLYREPWLAKAVHRQHADYEDVLHDDADGTWNPSDYAFHLTRRARGLPLWFSLAVNGTDAYRDAVETALATAQATADVIDRVPHLELLRRPELSVVLFRRIGWDRATYDRWSARLLETQTGFVTPTTWEGKPAARLAFVHPHTTVEMVEEILATMA